MTEDAKPKEPINMAELFGPPFFGVGFGEKLGSFEARLGHVEKDISEIKGDIKNLNAKVEAVVQAVSHLDARLTAQEAGFNDKLASLEERFNEKLVGSENRTNEKFADLNEKLADLKKTVSDNNKLLWGMFIALMAAIIVQKFI